MTFDKIFSSANISSSGLSAERLRMEVVANNIANAHSTQSPAGGPFRRQEVIFASVLEKAHGGGLFRTASRAGGGAGRNGLGGVEVVSTEDDPTPFRRVHQPGHPDADEQGFVQMPNVDLPVEMVNLITASRAYEANLRALQAFRQMADQALALMRR